MWLFIAGIYFPLTAAALGVIFGVFKLNFALGYKKSGPRGRLVGAVGSELSLLGLLGLSIASGYLFLQGQTA